MGRREKTKAELKAELKEARTGNIVNSAASFLNTALICGTIITLGFITKDIFANLAGKVTIASIFANFLANVSVSTSIAWGCGISGVGYGIFERNLRKKKVKELTERNKQLELEKDPRRTSSTLTEHGETNPSDLARRR